MSNRITVAFTCALSDHVCKEHIENLHETVFYALTGLGYETGVQSWVSGSEPISSGDQITIPLTNPNLPSQND